MSAPQRPDDEIHCPSGRGRLHQAAGAFACVATRGPASDTGRPFPLGVSARSATHNVKCSGRDCSKDCCFSVRDQSRISELRTSYRTLKTRALKSAASG